MDLQFAGLRTQRAALAAAAALSILISGCVVPPPGPSTTTPQADTPQPPPAPPSTPAPPPPPAAPPPPPPTLPHSEAVLNAANTLFSKANLQPADKGARYTVLVDPLVDGVTRMQTKTTQAMETRIVALAKQSYPQFEVKAFNAANLAQSPLLIVGTFTPINQEGKTEGERSMYRFCLVMVDLKSGKLVSKAVTRSKMEAVDATPPPFFVDAPAWSKDPVTEGYVKTCQASKPGDAIQPSYVEGLVAASITDEAIRAYNGRQYKTAQTLFNKAAAMGSGPQLRAMTGQYLSSWKLGQREASMKAFANIVDYGIAQGQLGVQFTFAAGSTVLGPEGIGIPNNLWVKILAQRLAAAKGCAEIGGHASRGGPEAINERLSAGRAEYVMRRLIDESPGLSKRLLAVGYGSRANLVGTGKDDASDALDRRVEVKPLACSG
ncbi:hypothetical protein ACFJGW_15635 [Burkholderiaceae bacterium UC74_6]